MNMPRAAQAPTPLLNLCASLYTAAMAQGRGQHDTASVAEVFSAMVGADGSSDT